jgi:hypothetical protein
MTLSEGSITDAMFYSSKFVQSKEKSVYLGRYNIYQLL